MDFCINVDMSDEINEARKLKCAICGAHDDMPQSLRIPTQCNAGDNGLHAELKVHLGHVPDACAKAMHVGCEFFPLALFCYVYRLVSCANSTTVFTTAFRCEMEGKEIRSYCG